MDQQQAADPDQVSKRALVALEQEVLAPASLERQETYTLSAMRLLQPAQRLQFVTVLRGQLSRRDPRAALSAGLAGWHELTDSLLTHCEDPDWFGLSVRRALVALGKGEAVIEPLTRDLTSPGPMQRLAALAALAEIPSSDRRISDALLIAIDDPDPTIYHGAYLRWIHRLHLQAFRWSTERNQPDLRTPLERLDLLATSKLEALKAPARAELKRIFNAILNGADPEALHLRLTPTADPDLFLRLGRALFNPELPIPVSEISHLVGAERLYAEALLARSLERWRTKSILALAELDARWTLHAIREAAQRDPEDDEPEEQGVNAFRAAAAIAADRFEGSGTPI